MPSPRLKLNCAIAAFTLFFACHPMSFGESEENDKDNKVNILFSYGPGGPLRPNNEFFAGEYIYFYVEADASLTKDSKFDLAVRSKVLHQSNENAGFVSVSEHVTPTSGIIFDRQATFHTLASSGVLPENLKNGTYILHVSVYDKLNNLEHQRQIPITIKEKQEFGLRHIGVCHGLGEHYIAGSNVFRASEIAKVTFSLGGVEKNSTDVLDTASLNTECSILNLKREVVRTYSFQGNPLIFNGLVDNGYVTLPLPQPGEFIVKLRVEDTTSGKADACELPLIVLPVPSPGSGAK